MMLFIPDYHLQFTFGCQIRFRANSWGIENVRVVLGFLKRARARLWVENHDPVPILDGKKVNSLVKITLSRMHK